MDVCFQQQANYWKRKIVTLSWQPFPHTLDVSMRRSDVYNFCGAAVDSVCNVAATSGECNSHRHHQLVTRLCLFMFSVD